jgi:RNA polymerase sigma-70 factor (ECF subfamily)
LTAGSADTLAVMSDVPLGDAELLARHVAGDPDAFAELVRRHRDRLWAVALRTLHNPDDAADALQDALLSAYRAAAGFRGGSAVTTWLHRIVVNACLDLSRRRAVRPTQPLRDEADATPSAPDTITSRETSLAVTAALRTLPFEQAAAVVLVDVEGFSVSEAAAMLDVPTGTVKSRCARARARLAEQLQDLDPRGSGNEPPTQRVQSPARYGEEHA